VKIVRSFKAVAWSFFGVRKRSEHERDLAELKPQHVIAAGLVGAALFVLALLGLIDWVVGSGIAAR
jgi:Protein of unknown function (DUF2970)